MSSCTCTPRECGPLMEWVPTTPFEAHRLSYKALIGGHDADNTPLWVIRARYDGDVIPGKLAIYHKKAFVVFGGAEHVVHDIEVLCVRPLNVRWVKTKDACIPPNALVGGNTSAGEHLYIGRAWDRGSLIPGKVQPSHSSLYISFDGKEMKYTDYEILCSAKD